MTLPASGPLSLSVINTEFGRGLNLNAYRGTGWYTDAGGSGTFSSGALSISDFYSKRLTSPQFAFTISSNQTNANLRTLAVNAGWNQSSKVVATINSGVYVSSNSTGTPGLTIDGSFPGGVELYNNGFIVGMGGAGGRGGQAYANNGVSGGAGGLALFVSTAISVWNNGTIAGGGGGGGGGSMVVTDTGKGQAYGGGGGGGGGQTGTTNSSAGAGGSGSGWAPGSNGSVGTLSGQGVGGLGAFGGGSGRGGVGGSWGSSGQNGFNMPGYTWSPGGGGAGGGAVVGNGNISWGATGTRLGAIA